MMFYLGHRDDTLLGGEDLHVENLELGPGASGSPTLNDAAAAEGTRTWTYTPDGDFNGSGCAEL